MNASRSHRLTRHSTPFLSPMDALSLLQRTFTLPMKKHFDYYSAAFSANISSTRSATNNCHSWNLVNLLRSTKMFLQNYCKQLIGYIQAAKRNQVAETLHDLENNLYNSAEDIQEIKLFLTDLYLTIKEKLSHLYHNADIPFPGNGDIIAFVGSRYYLYEIILYFTEQFELIMRAIGNPSSDSVMDDIIHYIEHNYMDNIKLENIAPLFGYNSSYLGKIFNKKVGEGFNVFIDKVRINHSKDLLINTELKVYEIAEKVGYRNVDYFHTKFKKYVKESPAEFRKKNK